MEQYVHKGDKLYVEGKIRNRSYDDQQGQKRFVSEIIVDNMELLSPKPQNAGEPQSEPEKTIQQPAQEDGQDKDLPF